MNKKKLLVDFLLRGLKGINEITENIDFGKTSEQYLYNQLPEEINKSFIKINYNENTEHIDETFFTFLKDNEQFFQNMKIINLDGKSETLSQHLSDYFQNMHSKYNEDKMFYFYFELILMEIFLANKDVELPRQELKQQLGEVIKNHCFIEKRDFSKCLGEHLEEIDVVAISDFNGNIGAKCEVPKQNLEKCVIRNFRVRKNNPV